MMLCTAAKFNIVPYIFDAIEEKDGEEEEKTKERQVHAVRYEEGVYAIQVVVVVTKPHPCTWESNGQT